jgi:Tol biopolymer transport system component
VSVASSGAQSNAGGGSAAISTDGRYVAFVSFANNLAPGASASSNVFLRDRQTSTTTVVNVALTGTTNNLTVEAAVSADGRYVAFVSYATNVVAGDTNNWPDVFVRDMQAATTERVSLASDDAQANDSSDDISISGDGRWVVFSSNATNLVPGDTNGSIDVFVRDRLAGTTRRVSTTAQGAQVGFGLGGDVSADGRYVVFQTDRGDVISGDTNNAYDIFVRANPTPTVESVVPKRRAAGASASLTIAGSGFLPGDRVLLGDGITVDHVTFVDPSHLSVHVTIAPDAAHGARDVFVVGLGSGPGPNAGAFGLCAGCLTIT